MYFIALPSEWLRLHTFVYIDYYLLVHTTYTSKPAVVHKIAMWRKWYT